MAIKDMIGPGFVGTDTIKWIPTRGLKAATGPPAVTGPACWSEGEVYLPGFYAGGIYIPGFHTGETYSPGFHEGQKDCD